MSEGFLHRGFVTVVGAENHCVMLGAIETEGVSSVFAGLTLLETVFAAVEDGNSESSESLDDANVRLRSCEVSFVNDVVAIDDLSSLSRNGSCSNCGESCESELFEVFHGCLLFAYRIIVTYRADHVNRLCATL